MMFSTVPTNKAILIALVAMRDENHSLNPRVIICSVPAWHKP
jgi:hypothetical protein